MTPWNLDIAKGQGTGKFVRYFEVLFHIFYYYWGKENCSLYRGLRYIEVRCIEVPLYYKNCIVQCSCFVSEVLHSHSLSKVLKVGEGN